MAIVRKKELSFENKKTEMVIYSRPGYGKTTLALSAPKPLLIDFEDGIGRVEACYHDTTMQADPNLPYAKKFDSFMADLTSEDLSEFDTIIVDTVGKVLELLQPVVIAENSQNSQKDGKTLSLKGYGALAEKFKDFRNFLKSLNKNIIWLAHANEQTDNEIVKVRLLIPGSTRETLLKDVDLCAYLELQGRERILNFTPTERFDAKGCFGIKGKFSIPVLKDSQNGGKLEDNHFITDLFTKIIENITKDKEVYNENEKIYQKAMEIKNFIVKCTNAEELNNAMELIINAKHALGSKEELRTHLINKAKELGAVLDQQTRKYTDSAA